MLSAPIRICSSQEMRDIDHRAESEYGITAMLLMENAGRAATQVILERHPEAGRETEVLVFAGKGNNAGDAFVVARQLLCLERKVRVFHLAQEKDYSGPTAHHFSILKKLKAKVVYVENALDLEQFFSGSRGPYTVVDGILGTGLKGSLEGVYFDIVELINRQNFAHVVSLDIPTGVHGDTGSILGTAVQATLTVSFGFPKLGHFLPPGATRRGELVNVGISLPANVRHEGKIFLLQKAQMAKLLGERDRYGHKNSFGHTGFIGGSPGRIGAIAMASKACHKIGTGLVTVATWKDSFETLLHRVADETMAVPIQLEGPELQMYRQMGSLYSSVVVGPGLGKRHEGKGLMEEILSNYRGPLVLDADALNLISDFELHALVQKRGGPTVLTPHPGEMARLLGKSKEEVVGDPVKAVEEAVDRTHAVVVLKGAATLIASPDRIYLNHYPNDGMATAGSGDVLSGIIGGLLGQHMDPFLATQLGVFLHSLAGDFAAKQYGHRSMTANSIIENIANAFQNLQLHDDTNRLDETRIQLR